MPTKKTSPLIEFEMTAVIPVAQYANVQPVVKGYGKTWEEARDDATHKTQQLWEIFAENKGSLQVSKLGSGMPTVEMQCYVTGTKVDFDPVNHVYYINGEKLLSGSGYAHQFTHEFDAEAIAPRSENKLQASAEEIIKYWSSKGDCSTTFGTALHQSLEHYGKYLEMSKLDIDTKTGEPKGIGIHATLLPIVEAYFKGREQEEAVYEPFVVDKRNMRCGQIDRLRITGNKKCVIHDYKTNGDLEKLGIPASLKSPFAHMTNTPLSKYTLQLSFYKAILEAAGWTVEGIILDWWNGELARWEEIALKPQEIDVPQGRIDVSQVV